MSDHSATSQSSGLAPNVAGALSYLLGPLTGILFLVIEPESRFVRFHAAQSIMVGVGMIAASILVTIAGSILAAVPFVGWLLALLLSLAVSFGSLALWLVLMFRAYQGQEWEIPVVGAQARRLLSIPAAR